VYEFGPISAFNIDMQMVLSPYLIKYLIKFSKNLFIIEKNGNFHASKFAKIYMNIPSSTNCASMLKISSTPIVELIFYLTAVAISGSNQLQFK